MSISGLGQSAPNLLAGKKKFPQFDKAGGAEQQQPKQHLHHLKPHKQEENAAASQNPMQGLKLNQLG